MTGVEEVETVTEVVNMKNDVRKEDENGEQVKFRKRLARLIRS